MSEAEHGTSDQRNDTGAEQDGQAEQERRVGTLEMVATAVSALLVALLLSVLLWDAFHPNSAPAFEAQPGSIAVTDRMYRVPVTVRNSGDDAAKEVVVHLELVASDSVLAESDLTIDWLPGNTSRQLVGLFARPASGPTPTGVRAEVRGYVTP